MKVTVFLKRLFFVVSVTFLTLLAALAILVVALHAGADMMEPEFMPSKDEVSEFSDSLRVWRGNTLRLNKYGQWEMMVSGSPYERGEAMARLAPDLLYNQEKVFADKLFEFVPNPRYRKLLYYFITIFNSKLGKSVPQEYRAEIKAMSSACTHEFDGFGNPYERQMQYHSAHDIGHVMQDYMLVGCTSFAVWGCQSADSSLLVARNFDFYMGDEFAANKIILFEKPDSGYSFVSVTWPGMIGVLSGMNSEGLTVTINASKLETPKISATPISILTRQILQYASDIGEAYRIATQFRTFVSESILIGSAKDGRAAIIEKTPSEIALYDPAAENPSISRIVCTNHYQSELFRNRDVNLENVRMSDSMTRMLRVEELLDSMKVADPLAAASVLRDIRAIGGKNVGYCNELSINQMLCMHSVIFRPVERKIWISSSPWQCGPFTCYDLDEVFSDGNVSRDDESLIPEDPIVGTTAFSDMLRFREMVSVIKRATAEGRTVSEDSLKLFVGLNPMYFNAYNMAGDCLESSGRIDEACIQWKKSLTFEMKQMERQSIEKKLRAAEKKLPRRTEND